tara:strand:+ start:43 stop:636 length:594 start_codon:yes stop_codon:yes gene_type:complete
MKNFIEVFDNALRPEECKSIIDFMNQDGMLNPGYVMTKNGKEVNSEYKDDLEVTLIADTIPQLKTEGQLKVDTLIGERLSIYTTEYVNVHTQLSKIVQWTAYSKYNLQKYNPGQGYYTSHCENATPQTSNRILAWMFYLNTVPDGGTYFDNYELEMDAVEGRLVIWPAYWTHFHRGIISETETKYIATGWYTFNSNT